MEALVQMKKNTPLSMRLLNHLLSGGQWAS